MTFTTALPREKGRASTSNGGGLERANFGPKRRLLHSSLGIRPAERG